MNEPERKPPWLWKPAVAALVPMVLCLIRVVSWQLQEESSPLKMTPRGQHLLTACLLAVPLFPAMALLWSAISRRLKTRLALVLVLELVLGTAAGVAAVAVWAPPLLSGSYQSTVLSPDGTREAHLFVDWCRGSVYVADKGALWGELKEEREVSCKDIGVAWLADGGVEVTGSAPEPFNLFLGPH